MADMLTDVARHLAQSAGWKEPQAQSGVFRFALDGGLDFSLFSLDGRQAFLRGEVCALPTEERARDDLLRTASQKQVGATSTRVSVLALEEGNQSLLPGEKVEGARLILFHRFALNADTKRTIDRETRDFLNDFTWWRSALSRENMSGASPFSMNFGAAFGNFS